VNVVKVDWTGDDYRLIGYNTDYIGFRESLLPVVRGMGKRRALVLGTGGAARAVAYALSTPWDAEGWTAWKVRMVSRQAGDSPYDRLTYNELTEHIVRQSRFIVNCTPLGMYPETDACPVIPYEGIGCGHILYDCIYNPEETLFLRKGRERGAKTLNGKEMLALQARAAWKIWDN
jgi:shikimate dehydrogenase